MPETTKTEPTAYLAYSRVFRVEQSGRTQMFFAVGRSRGHQPMFLDKVGCRPDRDAMQAALDAWAKRNGHNAIHQRTGAA